MPARCITPPYRLDSPPVGLACLATWRGPGCLGCHHNRVHGGYHCHRGAFKGAMFDSQAEVLQALQKSSRSPAESKQPSPTVVLEFLGKVVGVSDGDTITVLHNGKGERIRLHGIDCPEKRQAVHLHAGVRQHCHRAGHGS